MRMRPWPDNSLDLLTSFSLLSAREGFPLAGSLYFWFVSLWGRQLVAANCCFPGIASCWTTPSVLRGKNNVKNFMMLRRELSANPHLKHTFPPSFGRTSDPSQDPSGPIFRFLRVLFVMYNFCGDRSNRPTGNLIPPALGHRLPPCMRRHHVDGG